MSIEEIAKKIGCSDRAVKQALTRGMKKLRDGRAEKLRDLMIAMENEQRPEPGLFGTERQWF